MASCLAFVLKYFNQYLLDKQLNKIFLVICNKFVCWQFSLTCNQGTCALSSNLLSSNNFLKGSCFACLQVATPRAFRPDSPCSFLLFTMVPADYSEWKNAELKKKKDRRCCSVRCLKAPMHMFTFFYWVSEHDLMTLMTLVAHLV